METASDSFNQLQQSRWQIWMRALRWHQWSKNILLMAPLIVAHEVGSYTHLSQIIIGFICFCCFSSSAYLMNDMIDVKQDRQHPTKRYRPLAARLISVQKSLFAMAALLLTGSLLSFFLPLQFSLTLLGYFILCLGYSLFIKKLLLVDVLLLAVLYTLRILAGCAATGIVISHWLLLFSIFIFFGFALLKRIIELNLLAQQPNEIENNRAYQTHDRPVLISMGVCACYLAILVFCLYINQPETLALYRYPEWLWSISLLLLFWLNRLWLLAHRQQLPDDPILFAVKDPVSYIILSLSCCFLYVAI